MNTTLRASAAPAAHPSPAQRRRAGRLRSVVTASSGTIVGSSLGALLPFVVSAWFGAGNATDVFFLMTSATLAVASVFALVVERAVVPLAAEALAAEQARLLALVRRITAQAGLAALGLTAVAGAAVVVVLAPRVGFDEQQLWLSARLAVILLPLPSLMTASGALAGALFATRRFGVPTLSVALRAGGALLAGLLWHDTYGLPAVAAGLVGGEAARAALLGALLFGRAPRPDRTGMRPSTGPFWRTTVPHLLSMGLMTSTPLIDKAVAAGLGGGAVTVLELCDKLFYAPLVLVGSGIAIVSGSAWADLLARGRPPAEVARDYWRSQTLTAAVSGLVALAAAATVWLAETPVRDLIRLDAGLPFASTFGLLVAGLPFAIAADLAVRLIVAYRRTVVLVVSAVGLLTLQVTGDVIGAALLGLDGIAVAATLVRIVNATVLVTFTWHVLRRVRRPEPAL